MRRAFVSYSRPIRFDGKSVNRGLSVFRSLPQARRIVGSGDENDWYMDTGVRDLEVASFNST